MEIWSKQGYFTIFGTLFSVVYTCIFLRLEEAIEPINIKNPQKHELLSSKAIERKNEELNFSQYLLKTFDWNRYIDALFITENIPSIEKLTGDLLYVLEKYILMEPKVKINSSCSPPLLPESRNLECKNHGNVFNGKFREKIPKIGILVQFGTDVDVLEIYLNEVWDLVDKFFILESTLTNYRGESKSLFWEKVRKQERFKKFNEKIVHLVMDDSESAQMRKKVNNNILQDPENIYTLELEQEKQRWEKFLEWNRANKYFTSTDILGFGDADEIPSRYSLYMLKNCVANSEVVDFGIWFPFGNIKYAFSTDFPVPGYPYSYGDPTFWTLRSASIYYQIYKGKKIPKRMRGTTGKFILGGIHMTFYGYLPFRIARRIICTDCDPITVQFISNLLSKLRDWKIKEIEAEYGAVPQIFNHRLKNITDIRQEQIKEIAILPWFYNCNRNRYPAFEGNHDTRLD